MITTGRAVLETIQEDFKMTSATTTSNYSVKFNQDVTIFTKTGKRISVEILTYKKFKSLELPSFEFTIDPTNDKAAKRHSMLNKLGYKICRANEFGYRYYATRATA